MKTKRMYHEPKMRVVGFVPTAMICQSPGGFNPGGQMQPPEEEE